MTSPSLSDYVLQHLFTGVQFYTIKAHPHEITKANINLARNHCPSRFIPTEDAKGAVLAQGGLGASTLTWMDRSLKRFSGKRPLPLWMMWLLLKGGKP